METHEGVGSAVGSLCNFLEKESCENIFSKNGKLKGGQNRSLVFTCDGSLISRTDCTEERVFFAIFWAEICCGTRTLLSRDSRCKAQNLAHSPWIIILDDTKRGCGRTEARAGWMDNGRAVMRSAQGLNESHRDAMEKTR